MDLGRYPSEVRAIADELLELLRSELSGPASTVLSERRESLWRGMSDTEREEALKLLGQTPSQRLKAIQKLEGRTAATLILRARYMGVVAAQALHFADRFQFIAGNSYRNAAQSAAREVLRHRIEPTLLEVYPRWDQPHELPETSERRERRSGGSRWRFDDEV